MPIIKSAKKKLRQDVKRTKVNRRYETAYKKAMKEMKNAKKSSVLDMIKKVYSLIDKAKKKKVIHKNKAARLKAQAAKLLPKK
ncbi:30S ribosomal protein S20 [Candidatus Roizmanbacteria bacterium]|jgi:small subunit ribosomal protein S20|nr:30S ribosomal protein S20 [Candidatus Roizmanbacteria bacterium]